MTSETSPATPTEEPATPLVVQAVTDVATSEAKVVRPKSCHVPPLREPPPPPSPLQQSQPQPPTPATTTTTETPPAEAPATPTRTAPTRKTSSASLTPRRRPYRPPETAEIVDIETIALADKSPFTTYVIDVHVPGQESFRIRRRYNQFYFLHKKLKAEGFIAERPALPPKRAVGHMAPEFIAQRREQLQQYLTATIKSDVLSRSNGFADFLDSSMPASEMLTDPEKEGPVLVFKNSRKQSAVDKMKAGQRSLFGSAWKSGWLVLKNNYVYLFRKPHGATSSKNKLTRKILGLEFCTVDVLDAERGIWELRSAIMESGVMVLRIKNKQDFEDWLFALRMSRLSKTEAADVAATTDYGASFRRTAVRVAAGGVGFMHGGAASANVPGGAMVRARSNATSAPAPHAQETNPSLQHYIEDSRRTIARPTLERHGSAREIVCEPDTAENIVFNPKRTGYIKAATVNKLFEKLFDTSWAIGFEYTEYLTAFLLTYRGFSTPDELLETLVKTFNDAKARPRPISAPEDLLIGVTVPISVSSTTMPTTAESVASPSGSVSLAPSSAPSAVEVVPATTETTVCGSNPISIPLQQGEMSPIVVPAAEVPAVPTDVVEAAPAKLVENVTEPVLLPEMPKSKPVETEAEPPKPSEAPNSTEQPTEATKSAEVSAEATKPTAVESTDPVVADSPVLGASVMVTAKKPPNIVQIRVCNIISKWIEVHFHDFCEDELLTNRLLSFIDNDLPGAGMDAAAVKLKLTIWKQLEPASMDAEFLAAAPAPIIKEQHASPGWAGAVFQLIDMSPIEIARQLSIIDFTLLKKIKPKECLNQAWSKPGKEQKAPNILFFIGRFNTLSRWASSVIARTEQLRARIAMLTLLIEIANQCFLLNNFNSALAICSGLESSAVYRLKRTWEAVPTTAMAQFVKLKALICRDNNFRAFREQTRNVMPPMVPYIGVFLTDLTMIDDGNPDRLPSGMINFEKNYLMSKVINEIAKCQQTPYCLRPVPEFQEYFANLPVLPEEDAYALSLKWEPRQTAE